MSIISGKYKWNIKLLIDLGVRKHPEEYTIHELYKEYPDSNINIKREQKLVESHQNLVFQFPIFNFSSPSLLKKWIDAVLICGWFYGKKWRR